MNQQLINFIFYHFPFKYYNIFKELFLFCNYFSVPLRFLTITSLFVQVELVDEIQKLWPGLSRIYLTEIHGAQPSQLNVYKIFLARHTIECPSFAQFLLVMMATPANTSLVECSFSQLEMVATKGRNRLKSENLKTVFFIGSPENSSQTI